MIDWLTLKLPLQSVDERTREKLLSLNAQICKFSSDGVLEWASPAFESIRSDSHQITMRVGSDFELLGSPARVNQANNVFGSDDIRECAVNMIKFASAVLGVALPLHLPAWNVTRIDITYNYDLGSPTTVLNMLEILGKTQGGHFQVSTSSKTVYWNKGSTKRMGKAYHKGPHLLSQVKKGKAEASDAQINYSQNLLRLELKLGRHFIYRNIQAWWLLTDTDLRKHHQDYFSQLVGGAAIMSEDDVLPELLKVAETEGRAKAAFSTWLLIKSTGLSNARKYVARSTFFKHKKLLMKAGISWADISEGNVVPFRMKTIELGEPVEDWPSNVVNF